MAVCFVIHYYFCTLTSQSSHYRGVRNTVGRNNTLVSVWYTYWISFHYCFRTACTEFTTSATSSSNIFADSGRLTVCLPTHMAFG